LLELQSIIARALKNDDYVFVASLDLSTAFDVVNVELLLKRMRIISIPDDVIELANVWLCIVLCQYRWRKLVHV
jgi:hypothetical protein